MINKAGTSATMGIILMNFFAEKTRGKNKASAAALLPMLVGEMARTISHSQLQKADEERADRNSLGLFPHQDALASALKKLESNTLKAMGSKRKPGDKSVLTRIFNAVSTHKSNEERYEDVKKYYQQALSFYSEHGFDPLKERARITGPRADELFQNFVQPSSNKPQNP
jgi:Zn-dependent protease with chaperone function